MNRVVGPQCPTQTSSRNVIIYFWVGFIRTCMIWLEIVRERIGRVSLSAISHYPFKSSLLDLNIARVTLGKSNCLLD